jgi:hypothetical protein
MQLSNIWKKIDEREERTYQLRRGRRPDDEVVEVSSSGDAGEEKKNDAANDDAAEDGERNRGWPIGEADLHKEHTSNVNQP